MVLEIKMIDIAYYSLLFGLSYEEPLVFYISKIHNFSHSLDVHIIPRSASSLTWLRTWLKARGSSRMQAWRWKCSGFFSDKTLVNSFKLSFLNKLWPLLSLNRLRLRKKLPFSNMFPQLKWDIRKTCFNFKHVSTN